MAATKTKKTELSNVDFLVRTLRTIAESGDCDDISLGIRLKACDRLALLTGVYTVVPSAKAEAL